MASGKPVVMVLEAMPPAANFAPLSKRAGGSTPAEGSLMYVFAAGAATYMDYKCFLIGYDGGGLTFVLPWSAASATSGTVRWGVAIRAIPDDEEDMDTSQTYDYNTTDVSPASAAGELKYTTITFTHGADMDNWANGQLAIVRVQRANAGTMSGNAELWGLIGKET